MKRIEGVNNIFEITNLNEDKLFQLLYNVNMDFMEIAFIDKNEGFIDDYHVHDWFDISFVLNGSVTYMIDDKKYKVKKGQVVIVSPGKYHKEISYSNKEFEVFYICIRFTKDGKYFNILQYLDIPEVTNVMNQKEIQEIFRNILNEVTYKEEGYLIKISAQVLNLLVALYRNKNGVKRNLGSIKNINEIRKDRITEDIKEYLEENYNKKISLNELSKYFFLSQPYISSIFKKQTGYTLIEYLNTVKISKAKSMFAKGEDNISKVAEEVGFNDIHYFYKVFKQYENMTPVQYIERKLSNQNKII